jgi:hypothetical protein
MDRGGAGRGGRGGKDGGIVYYTMLILAEGERRAEGRYVRKKW